MQLVHHQGKQISDWVMNFLSVNNISIFQVPYATLIALIMCWAGVGVFCGTLYRGVNLTLRLLQDVFKLDRGLDW